MGRVLFTRLGVGFNTSAVPQGLHCFAVLKKYPGRKNSGEYFDVPSENLHRESKKRLTGAEHNETFLVRRTWNTCKVIPNGYGLHGLRF